MKNNLHFVYVLLLMTLFLHADNYSKLSDIINVYWNIKSFDLKSQLYKEGYEVNSLKDDYEMVVKNYKTIDSLNSSKATFYFDANSKLENVILEFKNNDFKNASIIEAKLKSNTNNLINSKKSIFCEDFIVSFVAKSKSMNLVFIQGSKQDFKK